METAKQAVEKRERLENLFKAYFNNKMMILLMIIENPSFAKCQYAIEKQKYFLDDIYRHFFDGALCRHYHWAFRWLFAFLDIYPNWSPDKRVRAVEMISHIYTSLGFDFKYSVCRRVSNGSR